MATKALNFVSDDSEMRYHFEVRGFNIYETYDRQYFYIDTKTYATSIYYPSLNCILRTVDSIQRKEGI